MKTASVNWDKNNDVFWNKQFLVRYKKDCKNELKKFSLQLVKSNKKNQNFIIGEERTFQLLQFDEVQIYSMPIKF